MSVYARELTHGGRVEHGFSCSLRCLQSTCWRPECLESLKDDFRKTLAKHRKYTSILGFGPEARFTFVPCEFVLFLLMTPSIPFHPLGSGLRLLARTLMNRSIQAILHYISDKASYFYQHG